MIQRCGWTLSIAAIVVAIQLIPGASELMALDRRAPTQLWRWLTAHLAHLSWDHLGWDLIVFVALGSWLEARSRARWAGVVGGAAIVISGAVWALAPQLQTYRGLSGIDSALFAAVGVALWRDATHPVERAAPVALGLALAGKITYELVTGRTLFAQDVGWVAVPLAHALGGGVGLAVWGLWPGPSPERSPEGGA